MSAKTGVRVRRLASVLQTLPRVPPGLPVEQAARQLWRTTGGPLDEIHTILRILVNLNLASIQQDTFRRSRAGSEIARTIAKTDLRPLGMTLVRAGYFHDQARALIEIGSIDDAGSLRCRPKLVRASASQLLGVLRWWSNVSLSPEIVIPEELLAELNTVWALLPPPVETPAWAAQRKEVGDRAEMYSLQTERVRLGPSSVVWVARDDDGLGYDIEDRSVNPFRCIEVKGRRDGEVRFFLTENEWAKAQELGSRYEVHFWGEIDLNREPAAEYAALKALGYPRVISNFFDQLTAGDWQATAVQWRITRKSN